MKHFFYVLFFILPSVLFSQQSNSLLNREWSLNFEKEKNIIDSDSTKQNSVTDYSCFKPFITGAIHIDKNNPTRKATSFWKRKIHQENLFIVNDSADNFYLTIDPLFNLEAGKDFADLSGEKLYKNTRGFLVRGDIGKKFSFESSFYENQATYAKYIDEYIAGTNTLFSQTSNNEYYVIPGQGRSKLFRKNGYDYAMTSGYISYSPNKYFNFQAGHGKHFVGDGYRSLLLSDNAFNYPYARITTTYKNIQYTNLYTSFMNLTDGGAKTPLNTEHLFQKKIGSFQLLSFNFVKRIQLGLFQGMIWEASDSANREHVNFNTFDPVIGVNTLNYGMHNKKNLLLGTTLKIKLTNSISLYGQYMLDDTYSKDLGDVRKKYGYQAGLKYFDLFTVKDLHLQVEYNSVRPYAYSATNPQQNYSHYNQALAHPLGSNFKELVGMLNYRIKDFFVEVKLNYAVKGNDSSSLNYGGNIFRSDNTFAINQNTSNISTTQGLKTTLMYQDIHIGYLVNASTNFNIVLGISNRILQTDKTTSKTQFIYFGIRTSLANFYYDF